MISGNAAQTLTLRVITLEDAAAVAGLSLQLGYQATAEETAERIGLLLASPEQLGLVACLGTKIVGWIEASISHHLQHSAHVLIGGLVVADGMRGLGVGKQLCAEVEQWSRKRGIPMVRVTSRSTREAAHRFYLREGYRRTKTSEVFEKVLTQEPRDEVSKAR